MVHLLRPADRGLAGGGHDHRAGLPAQVVGDVAAEVFDDNLHLLGDGGWVEADEAHHVGHGRRFVDFLGSSQLVADLGPHLVGRVVAQHVEDEALFDGLAHRIGVEGDEVAVRGFGAEQAQGLALGRGGERHEGHVLSDGDGFLPQLQQVVGGVLLPLVELDVREQLAQRGGAGAGLGGVRLIRDHAPAPAREVLLAFEEC